MAKKLNNRPQRKKAFGNKDEENQYPITQDVIDKGRYVLLHFKNHKHPDPNNASKLIDSGDVDSSSKRIGIYTKNTYDEYVREDEKEGKVNTFNKMLGKYIILHDPTLESGKSSNDDENADHQQNNTAAADNDQPAKLTKEQLLAQLQEYEDAENNESVDLMQHSKNDLLAMVTALDPQPTADELKGIETSNKATIIELINKYKNA